ncbi:Pycsar system effector family protein [Flavobacterium geliluteum]|uniref:Pycsar effector protein domain-containing protein n=1 Tax=Flavobacterium geliluteum TaxID=2816120 RepID=A0A940X9S1_9FLAO|nr:Pycsar system effector family protein [Flavobacterium geliluteum]MBP4138367.1 hypothetical protein [Flavobacterium geliluteum]
MNEKLSKIREYAFEILTKYENLNPYNNLNRLFRIENYIKKIIEKDNLIESDKDNLFAALYFLLIEQAESTSTDLDFEKETIKINEVINLFQEKFKMKIDDMVKTIAVQALPINVPITIEAKILVDAIIMDFADDNCKGRIKLMYEQILLHDFNVSRTSWYDTIIPIIENYKAHTDYAKDNVKPQIEKLVKNLKKEKKEVVHVNEKIIQKELNISDDEIQKLKKEIAKTKDRDDRGIQTLFRTTSKNHYTLNQMVDSKARIMITVNSIILSLVLGGIIGNFDESKILKYLPIFIFSLVNLVSITFAIIAITPSKTQGNFSEEDIRSKKGNLLYFGNFHDMHYRDFEWGFLQLLNDKNYLYTSMIRDYYYQAQGLNKKYKYIRVSLYTFIIGLGFAILMQAVFRGLDYIW